MKTILEYIQKKHIEQHPEAKHIQTNKSIKQWLVDLHNYSSEIEIDYRIIQSEDILCFDFTDANKKSAIYFYFVDKNVYVLPYEDNAPLDTPYKEDIIKNGHKFPKNKMDAEDIANILHIDLK